MTFSVFNNNRTLNSIKAGRGMSILYDGPQNLLTFDIATTLPVNILTALGTSLRIKSNSIMFEDEEEDSNTIMEVTTLYVAILRHLDMGYRNI